MTRPPEQEPLAGDTDDAEDRRGYRAPVVTDDGVYGTLPERRRALQEYERQERPWRDTWVRLAAVVLAVSTGAWLALLSASQVTSEQVARPALETLTETMTGLPGLLELHAEAIEGASGNAAIPGYPIEGVTIPPADRAAGEERWREVVLGQSSALLYASGPGVLAADGEAESAGTFSTSGGTRLLMGVLTQERHESASRFLWPLGLTALGAAIALVIVGAGFGRFMALGFALAAAALPAIAAGVLGFALVTFIGSDGSELAEAGHQIASNLVRVPFENGLVVLIGGIGIAIAARVAGLFFPGDRRDAFEG